MRADGERQAVILARVTEQLNDVVLLPPPLASVAVGAQAGNEVDSLPFTAPPFTLAGDAHTTRPCVG